VWYQAAVLTPEVAQVNYEFMLILKVGLVYIDENVTILFFM
jgi:hypothetical protein